MADKTVRTAVVVIPPEDLWEPVQAIRREHDRQVRRWMPHVTLLYPFRPAEDFDALASPLAEACRAVEAFEVTLARFDRFRHGSDSFTVWLRPEPTDRMAQLQEAVWRAVPDCDDVRMFAEGYQPHLSVGQARRGEDVTVLMRKLQAAWRPLTFTVTDIRIIRRGEPPDDVFQVDRAIALGGAAAAGQAPEAKA